MKLAQYQNGNYTVSLFEDGTKVRENNCDTLVSVFPENVDIKLTGWCNNQTCRRWCHEQSNLEGKHGDLALGLRLLQTWQPGCECAFGGGSTLSHPLILPFLEEVKKLGLISNVTVSSFHVRTQLGLIDRLLTAQLIRGVGCSYSGGIQIESYIKTLAGLTNDLVFHLIVGIHTLGDLNVILENVTNAKVLLLGYKTFGNGVDYGIIHSDAIANNTREWFTHLHQYLGHKGLTLSFDNLALHQLAVRRFFIKADWQLFYQGDDGFASMYVDLVRREYAVSSRSPVRFSLGDQPNMREIFQQVQCSNTAYANIASHI